MAGQAMTWEPADPYSKYGLASSPASNTTTELNAIPSPTKGAAAASNPLHPENPLFWFGVLAATTFGLMAFSTNVRVGNAKAGLSVGDPK